MRCEVCGRKIHTEPVRANIEGATLTVCIECSKHGKVVYQEFSDLPKKGQPLQPSPTKNTAPLPTILRKPPVAQVQITTELVDGYATKIRVAREKLVLTHEDLGKKINEKASLLKHIETGRVAPNNLLANKLEHILKIKLMVPIADEKVTTTVPKIASEGLTLGDLIGMDKDEEASSKRKRS